VSRVSAATMSADEDWHPLNWVQKHTDTRASACVHSSDSWHHPRFANITWA